MRPLRQALALALLWLGLLQLAWAASAAGLPLAVSLLQPDGATVQLRLRMDARLEPVLDWSGASTPAPHRLVLVWTDAPTVTLTRPLPVLPPGGEGPLQALALHSTPNETRLELMLGWAVSPHLRRVGDSWVLRLEPTAPPQAGIPREKSGFAQCAREEFLVDVTVNGQKLPDVVHCEQTPGGQLLVPVEAWNEAHLAPPDHNVAMCDGTPAYELEHAQGTTWQINRQSLQMDITAPASAFVGSKLGAQDDGAEPPPRPQPGVMLNYDLTLSHSGGQTTSGATLEALAFNRLGTFVSSALVSDTGSEQQATRLDTYWRYDLPQRMETLVVGDTVGVSGGWSRPARYGGIRWGRDFDMHPGFVTLPQISMAGQATLPSTVDVLVNNARRLSQSVPPGPFDLPNVPIVTGAGEIDLVVRDLLGRETVVRQSYYASPRLLASGLTDFSFEAGWLRTGYGRDSDYGDGFGAATWRQGLTNRLTGEARLELQGGRRATGVELAGLLGDWGVARLALAAAAGDRQGQQESGHMLQAGIERNSPRGGGALQYEYASQGFAPFGEAIDPAAVALRPRERWLASLGGSLWDGVGGGLSYVRQTRWDGDRVTALGLSLSLPLWRPASLSLVANKRLEGEQGWYVGVTVNLPLDSGLYMAGRVDRGTAGQLTSTVSAARNPPAGPGLGWRLEGSSSDSQRAQAGLQYHASHSEWALDAVANGQGEVSTRVGGRGSVGWLDGLAFASRPVGDGSVAVVKVAGVEGVPIQYSHQVVTRTDARGLAFVPGLLPWQKNRIEIDPVDLPLDVQVTSTTQEVRPYARSGVVVDFGARRTRQALVVLQQRDGTPVPVGAQVRLLPDGPEFITGRRGEVWLTDLPGERLRLQVHWPKGDCTLGLVVPPSPDGAPGKIGPLACEEGQP